MSLVAGLLFVAAGAFALSWLIHIDKIKARNVVVVGCVAEWGQGWVKIVVGLDVEVEVEVIVKCGMLL